jgi:hypothetical protein
MKKKDYYNYDNPKFKPLREPMREVMTAYGEAERFFALIKEITWYRFGMKSLTDYIHALEHIQPDEVDTFKDIFAENGLSVEYPPIGELTEELNNLDRVFEVCVGIIDQTDLSLNNIIIEIDTEVPELSAMARSIETLLMRNSKNRTFLLEAWAMWDTEPSYTSFDNWVEKHEPFTKGNDVESEEDDD